MSTVLGDALVRYRADVSNLSSGVKQVKSEMSSVKDTAEKSSGGLKSMFSSAVAFAGGGLIQSGLSMLKDQIGGVFQESMDAQAGMALTTAVLKSTHAASGETAQSISDLAGNLSHLTKFSDDTVQAGENMLLTFTNIGKTVFPQATKTVLDMSQALGQDTKSSAIQLGKALNDPITGVSALQRVGVTFTQKQKDLIKTYMDHNQVAKAQGVILKELQTEFGGAAEAAGKTFGGQLTILGQRFADIKQTVGDFLMPKLVAFVSLVSSNIGPAFNVLGGIIQKVMGYLQGASFAGVIADFQSLGNQVANILGPALSQIGPWLQNAFSQIGPLLTGVVIPAIDNLVFGFEQFLEFMQGASPWVEVIKDGLLAIGIAIAAMKIAQFVMTIPALIGQLAAWAVGQWAVASAAIATALPYIAIGALIAVVVFGIIMAIQHWGQIVTWLGNVWKTISTHIGEAFSWLGTKVHDIIFGIIGWFNNLAGIFKVLLGVALVIFAPIVALIAGVILAVTHWAQIMGWFQGVWGTVTHGIGSAFSALGSLVHGIWSGIVGAIKGAINDVIGAINGFIGFIDSIQIHIPSIGVGPIHTPSFDWNGLGIPQIPYLASGGYIQSTGIAMVHAGETVVPAHASSNGGGTTIIFEVDSVEMSRLVNKGTDRLVRLKLGAGGRAA